MLTTPQAPPTEQRTQEPAIPQMAPQPMPQPPATTSMPPTPAPGAYVPGYISGYTTTPMTQTPATQARFLEPTGGQRLGLAVASLALMIPLFAIGLGVISSLLSYVTAGVAITVGLIAAALVVLCVIAVNLLFNWDMITRKR